MTINKGMRFLYAGQDSEEFEVMLCSIGNINTETNDEETSLVTSKSPFKDSWDLHYIENTAPLNFTLTIADINGLYLDSDRQRILKRWLCKDKRYWLQVDQDDLMEVYYYCIMNNPRPVNNAKFTGGMELNVICDCGHAWSYLHKEFYETNNGVLTFDFNNVADYDNYILYPTVIINPTKNGNISIRNNTTGDEVVIKNCITNEIITIDGRSDNAETTSYRRLLDDWNKNVVELITGVNNLTLTGNFKMLFEYRMPIRVGG